MHHITALKLCRLEAFGSLAILKFGDSIMNFGVRQRFYFKRQFELVNTGKRRLYMGPLGGGLIEPTLCRLCTNLQIVGSHHRYLRMVNAQWPLPERLYRQRFGARRLFAWAS